MKLRNKILAVVLPLTLIPFVLAALAVYYFIIRADRIQVEQEQHALVAEAIVNLRKEMETVRGDAALIADLPACADYLESVPSGADRARLETSSREIAARTIIQLFFERHPYYSVLSLVDGSGRERIKFSRIPGPQPLGDLRHDDAFKRTLISGAAQLPVRQVGPDRFTSTFAHAVRRKRFLGGVIIQLNADVFQRSLRPLLASHGLATLLFDDRGLAFSKSLAAPEEEDGFRQIDLSAEAQFMLASPMSESRRRQITGGDREYLFTVYPAEAFERFLFEPQSGENWFLGVLRPSEALFGHTQSFRAIFSFILAAAVGAVLWVSARYARRFTEPLERMTHATAHVAQGRFDVRLDIATGDEVEELAAAVNQMARDLEKYRADLIRSAKLAAIGEMASEISHEIQNRISGLSLWIQYMDAELPTDDPRREYLDEMKQGLRDFMSLLSDLKQFYGSPTLQRTEVKLNELVIQSVRSLQPRIDERGVEVELDLDPDLPAVVVDLEKIRSVLLNLVMNALEALDDTGRITIQTQSMRAEFSNADSASLVGQPPRDAVRLSVQDNGAGIAEEDLPRIFYPFYSTKAHGGGLGLAIASNLVTAHGGRIEVDSGVGRGSRFSVILPRLQALSRPGEAGSLKY